MQQFDESHLLSIIIYPSKEATIIQHLAAYFDKLAEVINAGGYQLRPLVESLLAFTRELAIKAHAHRSDADTLRKEQKAWTKEKTQLLKSQKTERAQLEQAKVECATLRAQQKTAQRKESDFADENERLQSQLDAANRKLADRDTQHSRELQSINDVKRNHAKELSEKQTAIQKLKDQLEERATSIKKLEQSMTQVCSGGDRGRRAIEMPFLGKANGAKDGRSRQGRRNRGHRAAS